MKDIVVLGEHSGGQIADITHEMLNCARQLARELDCGLTCVLLTDDSQPLQEQPLNADKLLIVQNERLGAFNPEVCVKVLTPLLYELGPRLVLTGNTGCGVDVAGPVSLNCNALVVGNCTGLDIKEGRPIATSSLYGGKVEVVSELAGAMALVLLLPGHYPQQPGSQAPKVEMREPLEDIVANRVEFVGYIEPEVGDVDITKADILIAAGRGLESYDNLEELEELAAALEGEICASRPVVDQGWLPRSRQVGRSGMIVKPRLYLALGLSGAPEHVEGMKEADLIVAVNTDENAPIFDIADIGIADDLFDIIEPLTEKIEELRGS